MFDPMIRYALLFLTSVGGVAWAFTSHKYDCFNIGPCTGDVDFWIAFGELACYSFLVFWIALVMITGLHSRIAEGARAKALAWSLAIALPPIALFTASWFFNLGVKVAAI